MLDPVERAEVAAAFGVTESQVDLDHFISHLLLAIARLDAPLVFFGGTALARTHLADPGDGGRLSEDIDLYTPSRREVASTLDQKLPAAVRRDFPGAHWDPALASVRSVVPGQFVGREGLRLRVQLLDSDSGGHDALARYPTEIRPVALRYGDVPDHVMMRVPTLQGFAAMKTIAWFDRRTARDLFDLAALARMGALDAQAAALVREVSGLSVQPHYFAKPPVDWAGQLGHQTGRPGSAEECLAEVRGALAKGLGWDKDGA